MKNGIVLCSGGLDSVTTAHYVKDKYGKLIILFFNYSQKSLEKEREFSKKCADNLEAEFIEINSGWLGDISESLINREGKFNKLKKEDLKDTREESKNWYVPCRNTIFLINAIALAESLDLKENKEYDVLVGFKNEGEENYPDTTKEFVDQINKLSEISCSKKINVVAPLIEKDKEDIISLGKELGINYENTFSCYIGKEKHCGDCLACGLRKQGFYWSGVEDPTDYGN